MRHLCLIISIVGLVGCGARDLALLESMQPQGTPYQRALSLHYKRFAISEADQFDWRDSGYFAYKGLQAAKGIDVAPELVSSRDIDPKERATLIQAREFLDQALTTQNKRNMPTKVAKLHYLYDCWVEQQEEGFQHNHIKECREPFYALLDEVNHSSHQIAARRQQRQKHFKVVAKPKDRVLRPNVSVTMPSEFQIIFEDKASMFAQSSMQIVNQVAEIMSRHPLSEVTLNGYADSYSDDYQNQLLSKKRANLIKSELVARGVDEKRIVIYAFDEDFGSETALNSRVDIIIDPANDA